VLGQNPGLLKSGKTPLATYQAMWQTLLAGKTWTGEFINLTRVMAKEQIEAAIIMPLIQSDGQVSHYVAIKEDITVKRQQEDQLRKLYLAVEQSPESIVMTNIWSQASSTSTTAFSATPATAAKRRWAKIRACSSLATHPRPPTWTCGPRSRAAKCGAANCSTERKDGSEYVELATISHPIRQPDGHITHYLAIKEDITDKKRMTDELDRHRLHLEELVAERTEALDAALQEQSALFETASVGIVCCVTAPWCAATARFYEMLGYAVGEQVGRTTRHLVPGRRHACRGGPECVRARQRRDRPGRARTGAQRWQPLVGAHGGAGH
jgi:two-component system sensor histidine kinase/response regulator